MARASRSFRAPTLAERRDEDRGIKPPTDPDELRQFEERKRKQEDSRRDPRIITRLPYRVLNYYLDDRHSHIYVVKIETNGNHPRPSVSPKARWIMRRRCGYPMVASF